MIGKKNTKKGLILKLDFEKAYNKLNWNFLISIMNKLGFFENWVTWITECILTASLSILVNGSPTKEFQMQKGSRQGDPLSPYYSF